jgi:hypothetical protein
MGRPARVADPDGSGQAMVRGLGNQAVDAADLLHNLKRMVMLDRETGGVVPPVFETFQAFEEDC